MGEIFSTEDETRTPLAFSMNANPDNYAKVSPGGTDSVPA